MKTLQVVARVYDTQTREFVQRMAEIPISDELAQDLRKAISGNGGPSPIKAYGHGDTKTRLCYATPLSNQSRYHIDPMLQIIDEEDNIIGGWRNM